jgi:SAM-dependent methyltransferase
VSQDRKQYWEERLRANAGLRGVGHISHSYSWNGWAYRVKKRGLHRLVRLARLDMPRARVLDIGSGTGFGIEFWLSRGVASVSGVDLTDHAVEHLRINFPELLFFQGDIGDPQFDLPGAPFDMVSAMEVLFHITDDNRYRRAFCNIKDALRPGGYLVFSDNFLRHGELRTAHQASRRHEDIMAAVREAGLEPVKRIPMFMFMGYPVDTTNARRQQIWRRTVGRAARSDRWGAVFGFLLAPVELVATAVASEGPTVELLLCRRPAVTV